ncbi:5-oxoprolinase subunit PxpA [Suttonella ornithocola]|uniref:LamB/YcsF family protein n=1 Tax=Suttonella ornithocola TaxID=279832 RepID=A0A380MRS7_9GAMM|nr:5-oxoprolinase subunit PxpA [Suttonella ornithocola]SUO95012.1 LamB/YcsF family protein [Suttonella ornithocola]
MKKWLLNADVGEGCDDSLIMPYLDCANICCGAHAGGEAVMQETLALAKMHGVMVGAHPGYADRDNFGRISVPMTFDALTQSVREQILALMEAAKAQQIPVYYVKPHGAMNHDMLQSEAIFSAICAAVAGVSERLALMVPTNAHSEQQEKIAAEYGLTIWWEVFADRAYEPSGLLRPRKYADAMHDSADKIVTQIERIMAEGKIRAVDGSDLEVSEGRTICVHGDHALSVEAVRQWAARH